MTSMKITDRFEIVFGQESTGDTPEQRAKTSKVQFVRSQIQLAPYSEGATGRVLSATEALRAFGWEVLYQAVIEGAAPLIHSPDEPAATIKRHRQELGLSEEALAKKAHISSDILKRVETKGIKTPFRILESLAQALALDEQVLGLIPNARRDVGLGVRLREMANSGDINGFTASTVLQLTEAAWIIRRQAELQKLLKESDADAGAKVHMPQHDSSFGYPAYEIGYRLAKRTRSLLGIAEDAPIASVRKIIEEDFSLPLVQLKMDARFAGATLANGNVRGIVVNESGMNSNVWIRRMTLCHELGHLLWDPDDRLQQVAVDEYAELEMSDRDTRRDPPEIRANAFAVAFLAPPSAVQRIAKYSHDPVAVVTEVMETYGIGLTAAKHHVKNITKIDTFAVQGDYPEPTNDWLASENLTLDYFPISSTPISRRGKFAWYVAKAFVAREISLDSAASWLAVSDRELTEDLLKKILPLGGSF